MPSSMVAIGSRVRLATAGFGSSFGFVKSLDEDGDYVVEWADGDPAT